MPDKKVDEKSSTVPVDPFNEGCDGRSAQLSRNGNSLHSDYEESNDIQLTGDLPQSGLRVPSQKVRHITPPPRDIGEKKSKPVTLNSSSLFNSLSGETSEDGLTNPQDELPLLENSKYAKTHNILDFLRKGSNSDTQSLASSPSSKQKRKSRRKAKQDAARSTPKKSSSAPPYPSDSDCDNPRPGLTPEREKGGDTPSSGEESPTNPTGDPRDLLIKQAEETQRNEYPVLGGTGSTAQLKGYPAGCVNDGEGRVRWRHVVITTKMPSQVVKDRVEEPHLITVDAKCPTSTAEFVGRPKYDVNLTAYVNEHGVPPTSKSAFYNKVVVFLRALNRTTAYYDYSGALVRPYYTNPSNSKLVAGYLYGHPITVTKGAQDEMTEVQLAPHTVSNARDIPYVNNTFKMAVHAWLYAFSKCRLLVPGFTGFTASSQASSSGSSPRLNTPPGSSSGGAKKKKMVMSPLNGAKSQQKTRVKANQTPEEAAAGRIYSRILRSQTKVLDDKMGKIDWERTRSMAIFLAKGAITEAELGKLASIPDWINRLRELERATNLEGSKIRARAELGTYPSAHASEVYYTLRNVKPKVYSGMGENELLQKIRISAVSLPTSHPFSKASGVTDPKGLKGVLSKPASTLGSLASISGEAAAQEYLFTKLGYQVRDIIPDNERPAFAKNLVYIAAAILSPGEPGPLVPVMESIHKRVPSGGSEPAPPNTVGNVPPAKLPKRRRRKRTPSPSPLGHLTSQSTDSLSGLSRNSGPPLTMEQQVQNFVSEMLEKYVSYTKASHSTGIGGYKASLIPKPGYCSFGPDKSSAIASLTKLILMDLCPGVSSIAQAVSQVTKLLCC